MLVGRLLMITCGCPCSLVQQEVTSQDYRDCPAVWLSYSRQWSLTLCGKFSYKSIGGSRGVPGARPPLWDPILSFSHTFLLKSAHVGGPRPPNGCTPPLWEILDPPLKRVSIKRRTSNWRVRSSTLREVLVQEIQNRSIDCSTYIGCMLGP